MIVVAAGLGYVLALKFESIEKVPLPILVAVSIFAVTYIAILSEKIHRTTAGICGAVVMGMAGHWLGFYSQTDAVAAIDWYTIGLLFAMMVIVIILGYIAMSDSVNPPSSGSLAAIAEFARKSNQQAKFITRAYGLAASMFAAIGMILLVIRAFIIRKILLPTNSVSEMSNRESTN